VASGVDEREIEASLAAPEPKALALRLAAAKALTVGRERPGRLVLGADQVLGLEGEILHKPAAAEAAAHQIARLAGRTHELYAAFVLARNGTVVASGSDMASLTMRSLDADAIRAYLAAAGDRVLDSVGGYQVEGLGIHLFARIDGDHSTILGLPLLPLLDRLRALSALAL
jgi:septum formation protein